MHADAYADAADAMLMLICAMPLMLRARFH